MAIQPLSPANQIDDAEIELEIKVVEIEVLDNNLLLILAIVVIGIVGVASVIFIIFCVWKRYQNSKTTKNYK